MSKNNFRDSEFSLIINALLRYFNFYPYYIISILFFIIISFFYVRYSDEIYRTTAKIQIIDDDLDSEMALPTAMTIFNRSMINLENEIEKLKSFRILEQVVSNLNLNMNLYSVGTVRSIHLHNSEWFAENKYLIKIRDSLLFDSGISNDFIIDFFDDKMTIEWFIGDIVKNKYSFDGFKTDSKENELPFSLDIKVDSDKIELLKKEPFKLSFFDKNKAVQSLVDKINIKQIGKESELLEISLDHPNKKIAQDILNDLIKVFDQDGIYDRRLVYKRTMDFVDDRYELLKTELEDIESSKSLFKRENNLTDLRSDAKLSGDQILNYENDLFKAESQLILANLFLSNLSENDFDYLPVNIGLENLSVNQAIRDYNEKISIRNQFQNSVGVNNVNLQSLDKEINEIFNNTIFSLNNYISSLEKTVNRIKSKENEFRNFYENVPENEKILRSIEREQKIKEALFLLLLQKREEAAINFAVTKPSIKIIDNAITNPDIISPKKSIIFFLAVSLGFLLPTMVLYIIFLFDTKIHTRDQLVEKTDNIPIIGEIPFISDQKIRNSITKSESRNPLAESFRVMIANLGFVLFKEKQINDCNIILVTSSVKGEGKTIISVNAASILASRNNKVLLIGSDLRNPQIHKFLGIKKETKGLTDYIYNSKDGNWKKFLISEGKLDILLSGSIPPNPTELISSEKFKNLILKAKQHYDYIIIDSAPCIVVSDTFEISSFADTTLYVVRSNFTDNSLCGFINECKSQNKVPNINLVLNGVGKSRSFRNSYKYNYSYNYGYGYGYGEEK